jgi:hypothetical protein
MVQMSAVYAKKVSVICGNALRWVAGCRGCLAGQAPIKSTSPSPLLRTPVSGGPPFANLSTLKARALSWFPKQPLHPCANKQGSRVKETYVLLTEYL